MIALYAKPQEKYQIWQESFVLLMRKNVNVTVAMPFLKNPFFINKPHLAVSFVTNLGIIL
jgi:hypothetical protein